MTSASAAGPAAPTSSAPTWCGSPRLAKRPPALARAPRRRSSLLLLVVVLVVIVRVLREVDGLLLLVRGATTVIEVVDPLARDRGFLVLVPLLFLGLDREFEVAGEEALLGVGTELGRRSLAAHGKARLADELGVLIGLADDQPDAAGLS